MATLTFQAFAVVALKLTAYFIERQTSRLFRNLKPVAMERIESQGRSGTT